MELFLNPDAWIALLTLTFLEIVLGIDNIVFISIAANKLPEHQRAKADKHWISISNGTTYCITFRSIIFGFP